MCRLSILAVAAVLPWAIYVPAAEAQSGFGDLTSRIPGSANTMVLFNVEKIQQSPLAQKENWRGALEKSAAAGVTVLPPEATKFVMASQMDFEYMHPLWNVAIADLKYEPAMTKAAVRHGGTVEQLGGREAAILPDDTYLLKFSPRIAAAMHPGNRQAVSRWVEGVYAGSLKTLSPYLKEAVSYSKDVGTEIIMAMDFTDVISVEFAKQRLGELESLKGKEVDLDKLAEVLASVRGVTLGITIRDKIYGAVKVDFSKDASVLGDLAKPLLLEILAHNGAAIDEFYDWSAKVGGTRVQLTGELYRSGMQRILSVLDAPPSMHKTGQEESDPEADQEELEKMASLQYFQTVQGYFEDLRSKRQSDQFVTTGQVGMWYERYARKIEQMPVLNVDEELLDWGAYVSSSLRGAETSMKMVGSKKRVREVNEPTSYNTYSWGGGGGYATRWGGRYGWRGGYVSRENLSAEQQGRTRIRTEETVKGYVSANDIMQQVDMSMVDIRRKMSQKYQVEF